LLPDGKQFLRGPEVKIPVQEYDETITISTNSIDEWSWSGWVDLREQNMVSWQNRVKQINQYVNTLPKDDSSSKHHHGKYYWGEDSGTNIGKVAAWIFINEDKGLRIKR
jgi:hypothetical protein